jgi:SAM-dependent methyltransferase
MISSGTGFSLWVLVGAQFFWPQPNPATAVMNYFAYPTVGQRYANGRPFFHPLAIKKIQKVCCENGRINRALDVGCGTGQSTLALLEIADEIIGVDNSAEMLSHVASHERIRYVEGSAERMTFADGIFGLVTVAGAFHWFDQQKFLLEAKRVLKRGGWLVIYNDGFTGRMRGNPDFEKWNRDHYLVRYPTPPRRDRLPADSDLSEYGLAVSGSDEFVHEVELTADQFVRYLLTQTNVISVVEGGGEDLQSATKWLAESIRPLFGGATEFFPFTCQIRFFKRT